MKVVAITGPRQCEIIERPMPKIDDNYCLVKILAAPMCTEFRDYLSGRPDDAIGHEAAGEVVEVARRGNVEVGQRVVVMPQNPCGCCYLCLAGDYIHCQSGRDPFAVCGCTTGRATYAEYLIQQDWMLLPIPDDISTDHAALACCGLGPSFNAVNLMNVTASDTVLVSGLGPVGMGAVINARVRGARVIGLDTNAWRTDLAIRLGAKTVIDPTATDVIDRILTLTGGIGADKSIEASSAESAPSLLVRGTRPKGEVTSIGWGGPIAARDIVAKGLAVRGAWHWNHLKYGREMFETIRRAGPLLDLFITHRFPMIDVKMAFETQVNGEAGKIILHPH